jgi:hypothetical protein
VIEYVQDEALPDRDEILVRLASHDREPLLRMLTLLCPCRNTCYDLEIWSKLPGIWSMQWDFVVREAAHHALGTLHEKSRVHLRSRRFIHELATKTPMGVDAYPGWVRREMAKGIALEDVQYPKAALRDVPTLLEMLASDEPEEVRDGLAALCPANGTHPSKRVWRAILDLRQSPDDWTRRKARRAAASLATHQSACAVRHQ